MFRRAGSVSGRMRMIEPLITRFEVDGVVPGVVLPLNRRLLLQKPAKQMLAPTGKRRVGFNQAPTGECRIAIL